MGSGISVTNKQAVEILKNDIKLCIKYKTKFSKEEKCKYEQLIEFFRNHDKSNENCNPTYYEYRNWLLDCEYDKLLKKIL